MARGREEGRGRRGRRGGGGGGDEPAEPLADVLARFLARSGFEDRLQQTRILTRWGELVGPEIAAVTRAVSISDDGTLFVAVRSHAWMSELTMMERTLLETVNQEAGARPILRVRWSLMRGPAG